MNDPQAKMTMTPLLATTVIPGAPPQTVITSPEGRFHYDWIGEAFGACLRDTTAAGVDTLDPSFTIVITLERI